MIKKRFLRAAHLLFILLLAIQFLPDQSEKEVFTSSLITFAVAMEVIVIAVLSFIKKMNHFRCCLILRVLFMPYL